MTSRDALPGLVSRDGAQRLDLDLLSAADASLLLTRLIGDRAAADPAATTALADQCGRLPLALRVAAELAVARPDVALAGLATELADQQQRLDLLDAGGDPRAAVRAVFSWSYRHLDAGAAHAFRMAGLHPGTGLDSYASAALTGATLEQAGPALNRLARAHLIHPIAPGRYGLHDLLRGYAHELAAKHDGPDGCQAALTRLLDHYLHAAGTATDTLYPAERHRRPAVPPAVTPAPPVTERATARAWLDAEQATIITMAAYAADDWPGHTTRLAATVARDLNSAGNFAEGDILHTHARHAARRAGDHHAEATALNNRGLALWGQSRNDESTDVFQQSQALFRLTGDRAGEAKAVGNLGLVEQSLGHYDQAADQYQRAIVLFHETGDRTGEGRSLSNLGSIMSLMGRHQEAAGYQERALALFREAGEPGGEGLALTRLGVIEQRLGRYQQATERCQEALSLYRETGGKTGEALALRILGEISLLRAQYQEAVRHYRRSLILYREIDDRTAEADSLNRLGEALLAAGRSREARARFGAGLALAEEIGGTAEQARAHNGLGQAHLATGNPTQAQHHWQQALALYTSLDSPEAEEVAARLTAMPGLPAPTVTSAGCWVRAGRVASQARSRRLRPTGSGGAAPGRR